MLIQTDMSWNFRIRTLKNIMHNWIWTTSCTEVDVYFHFLWPTLFICTVYMKGFKGICILKFTCILMLSQWKFIKVSSKADHLIKQLLYESSSYVIDVSLFGDKVAMLFNIMFCILIREICICQGFTVSDVLKWGFISPEPPYPPSLIRVFAMRSVEAKDPSFLHADSEDSDQTGRMPWLKWVFTGRTCHFVGFVMRRLKYEIVQYWSHVTFSLILFDLKVDEHHQV